ncbi:MAG: DUF3618 domain-containing protein [Desulfuromonadales bacterium]|nr:DUF3618 domain-containing protein [Desulfuromonadales bacterium]
MTPRDEEFIETPEEYAGTAGPRLETQPLSEKSTAELEQEIAQIRAEMDSTLSAIERRFSTGDMVDRAIHYLSGGPSEYATNLARTVRDNPIPTTLFGIGLTWLMIGAAGQRAQTEGKWEVHGSQMGAKGSQKWQEMTGRLSGAYHRAEERIHEVGEKAKRQREQLGEKVRSKREQLGESARSQKEQLSEKAESTAGGLRQQADRARSGFSYMLHEQPLLLGFLCLGIGMLVGSAMPVSRREKELTGEAAREFGAQLKETAQEQVEKVRKVAETTLETAREETERQFH